MGVSVFLEDSLRSNSLRKLINMDRQYYMQSLALVSVCRKFSAPPIQHSKQGEDLSKAVHKALTAASSTLKSPGRQLNANEDFDEARRILCAYVKNYGIGQQQNPRQSNYDLGKSISNELLESIREDKFAVENLEKISKIYEAELSKIQNVGKCTISICYWPEKPFVGGKTQCYLYDRLVKVEKGTALEVLLLRVLTHPTFSKTCPISLDQRPELYERLPETVKIYDTLARHEGDRECKAIRSLDPYQTVDFFTKEPLHIILSLRDESQKYLEDSHGELLQLPSKWTNAWCLQDDPCWVVCKYRDPYSSLYKYPIINLRNMRNRPLSGEDSAISYTGSESHSPSYAKRGSITSMPTPVNYYSNQTLLWNGVDNRHSHSSHVSAPLPGWSMPEPHTPQHAALPDAAALPIETSIDESITRNASEAATRDSTLVANNEQLVGANPTVEAEPSPQEGSTTTSIAPITTQPVPQEAEPSSQRGSTISPASITVVQPAPQQHRTRPGDIDVLASRGMSSQKYDVRMKPVEVPKKKGVFARIVGWVTGS